MGLYVYLDDERETPLWFDRRVYTVEEAINLIETEDVEFISLDNDLGLGLKEGYKVADYLEEKYFLTGKFIGFHPHTANPNAFERIMTAKRKVYLDYQKKGGTRECP